MRHLGVARAPSPLTRSWLPFQRQLAPTDRPFLLPSLAPAPSLLPSSLAHPVPAPSSLSLPPPCPPRIPSPLRGSALPGQDTSVRGASEARAPTGSQLVWFPPLAQSQGLQSPQISASSGRENLAGCTRSRVCSSGLKLCKSFQNTKRKKSQSPRDNGLNSSSPQIALSQRRGQTNSSGALCSRPRFPLGSWVPGVWGPARQKLDLRFLVSHQPPPYSVPSHSSQKHPQCLAIPAPGRRPNFQTRG